MDSRLYWIWLQQALPLGCTAIGELLDQFGHAEWLYRTEGAALREAGVSPAIVKKLENKSLDKAYAILNRVLETGDWVLTPEDALYPLSLRQSVGCPAALYCRGTLPDLDSTPSVAVVGTRHASAAGMQETRALSAGLAAGGVVVVSGGAMGIDRAAHMGALEAGGRTIVVMGSPLNENYPRGNEDMRRLAVERGSLLVSEFPPDEPYRCDFHVRNRLMVGLSQGVCLGETPARSGARISARLAREQGREVFALPGALAGHLYDGSHQEIQHGATLVMRATDILREYAPLFPGMLDLEAAETAQKEFEKSPTIASSSEPIKKKRRPKTSKRELRAEESPVPVAAATLPDGASEAAKQAYAALTSSPQPVDDLALAANMAIPALLAALTELEMLGCAENSAGGQYKRR